MKVALQARLNNSHIDANQSLNQRQLEISIASENETKQERLPLNLCFILDHSGSMQGKPLSTVKEAAMALVEKLTPNDVISVIAFDHEAKVIVSPQKASDLTQIKTQIQRLKAEGGTSIDEGLKLGLQEIAKNKGSRVSQILLLTDGENEHGDNERCLKLGQLAAECNVTLNTLGFGNHWNQDVLEAIADSANGSLSYIEKPENAVDEFGRLFTRMESVGLTNAYLLLELSDNVRLAELKPVAQVYPETIELPLIEEEKQVAVRLGDLMTEKRIVLANLYVGELASGLQTIATVQVRYDDPSLNSSNLYSETIPIEVEVEEVYKAQINPQVEKSILTLAKYRQTQIAEAKLAEGDSQGAATMLQVAAKTAIQLGDETGATVLQVSATRLQSGEELSETEKKKTRIASKTILQS